MISQMPAITFSPLALIASSRALAGPYGDVVGACLGASSASSGIGRGAS